MAFIYRLITALACLIAAVFLVCLLFSQVSSCPGWPGDLLVFPRYNGVYDHYAVNVGRGYLVHMTGGRSDSLQCVKSIFTRLAGCEKAEVKMEKCTDVVKPGSTVHIENGTWNGIQPLPVTTIIKRARSKVGTQDYHLLENNCEHFARWCRYGVKASEQAYSLKLILVFLLAEILYVRGNSSTRLAEKIVDILLIIVAAVVTQGRRASKRLPSKMFT